MSLSEETLSLKEQPPFTSCTAAIAVKLKEQQDLDDAKAAFFRAGGKVKTYSPTSVLIEPEAERAFSQVPNQRKKTWSSGKADNSSVVAYHSRKKTIRRMNITEKKLVSKTVYPVNIAGIFYGSFPSEDEAVKFRDDKRKALGMPVADY